MHRFHRMHLSPEAAMARLDVIDLEEKSRLAEGISLIAVIDHRRDFLAAGYSCMRDYCMSRLHMSEDQAFRRIQVARVALKFPDVFECLADGRLSLATASVLAPHLVPETAPEVLAAAAFKRRDELLQFLTERSKPPIATPAAPAGEPHVDTSSGPLAPGQVHELSDLWTPPDGRSGAGSLAPPQVTSSRRGRVSPSEDGGYDVRLTITDEEHEDLRRAQALLGHAVPSGDPALIYARAMKHYVAHLEKQRLGAKRAARRFGTAARASREVETPSRPLAPAQANEPRGRGIPKALRRHIWERDGGRCAFVGTDGHRCEAARRLEFDHIAPVANGGRTTPNNLRLLCRAHNQFEAERVLGKDHVASRRESAQRDRARAKAAAAATVQRAKARAAAMQARRDDILAALRNLGFPMVDAKRGAALADAMPDASLEACVRQALKVLTRATAMRGERRARCMA